MAVTLQQIITDLYGVKSTYHTSQIGTTVGLAVSQILANNPNRLSFVIFNLSINALYISPNNNVSVTDGIYIAPNGGSVQIIWDRDFEMVSHEFFGIASGAASNIFIIENISI